MPVIPNSSAAGAYGLYIQGSNVMRMCPADSVSITETGSASNAVMEFDLMATDVPYSYMLGLWMNVELRVLATGRRLFFGKLLNLRRSHGPGNLRLAHCTAVSMDVMLDQRVLPNWTSKRPNVANIATDRLQVQNVMQLAGVPYVDALDTYVNSTQATMPVVNVPGGGSVREILKAIAEAAATAADPTQRRFYVDFDGHLRWFKGTNATTAPYILGDADYVTTVKATSGILSLVSFREYTGTPLDPYGVATVTLNGGFTQNVASMVPNQQPLTAITFNGTTGYASLAGASLHQADGPWSIEMWVKRGATLGTAQTLVSAGTNDYLVAFDASNKLIVQKEGTGDNFVSTPAYTSTDPMHIVVTRAVGTTTVYVNGASAAGTTTARTFASAAGAVNIGRKLSTTNLFLTGTVQLFSFYNATLSAATALAHYNDGWTITPDAFEFESDITGAGSYVYVKGGNATGTGWVTPVPAISISQQQFIIDRPQSTTAALKAAVGTGYLKAEASPLHGFRATVTGFDGWRAGQTVTIDDASLSIPDLSGTGAVNQIPATYEIKQVDTTPNMGNGVLTYDIYGGTLPWSGAFDVQRKKRR